MPEARKWICSKCGAVLGVITPKDQIRIGNHTDATLPVEVKCACGQEDSKASYEECDGPLCEYPEPLTDQIQS